MRPHTYFCHYFLSLCGIQRSSTSHLGAMTPSSWHVCHIINMPSGLPSARREHAHLECFTDDRYCVHLVRRIPSVTDKKVNNIIKHHFSNPPLTLSLRTTLRTRATIDHGRKWYLPFSNDTYTVWSGLNYVRSDVFSVIKYVRSEIRKNKRNLLSQRLLRCMPAF